MTLENNNTNPTPPLDETQQELTRILERSHEQSHGDIITHIGRDGVIRWLTDDRDVIDAVPLNPKLLKAFLDRLPLPFDQTLEDKYRGIDGTKVIEEQLFNYDKSLLPPPLTQAQRDENARFYEEHKDVLEEKRKMRARGKTNPDACPVRIVNNYNLDPKSGIS